jgi:hypothetical protein
MVRSSSLKALFLIAPRESSVSLVLSSGSAGPAPALGSNAYRFAW